MILSSVLSFQEMEFQKMLLKVQESLSQVEVQELAFLCTDLLGRRDLSKVATARDLFLLLKKEDLLSSDDYSLLVELLETTKRYSLLKELNLSQQLLVKRISPFRSGLYVVYCPCHIKTLQLSFYYFYLNTADILLNTE